VSNTVTIFFQFHIFCLVDESVTAIDTSFITEVRSSCYRPPL